MAKLETGLLTPLGYRAAAVRCGVKSVADKLDLALILSDAPAVAAGAFTTNRFRAASVQLDQKRLKSKGLRGIVVNAGNANACTGERGLRDAEAMAEAAALACGARKDSFLVASTGIIGHPLPMDKILTGIKDASGRLSSELRAGHETSYAIMTTDTKPKETCAVIKLPGGGKAAIGGICKGSGMIAPKMATMLCFLLTDVKMERALLQEALSRTVEKTFNCVTVDGDSSTNDTALLMSNGAAPDAEIASRGKRYDAFCEGLYETCSTLAKKLAQDGEGATKFVEVNVTGAPTEADAKKAARAIANSPLVKCAIHGGDPNWGRIICAAGYSGALFPTRDVVLHIGRVCVFRNEMPTKDAAKAAAEMKKKEVVINLSLGKGPGNAIMWTCDFSAEYVAINALYHT
ncbi:MAG TPA: bifunctional glutamate N-acetyltransferase/amino-acid acetyltransferase ArgJ [Candidatus Brocadiia bacterium]|nr:bifunctional glutamate N-acetyltransferase/amino-acid acetyltransferase ArgJ [Candidatus Brocadiia bacterium]